jgi:serine/threonine-protein kinase HipA
VQRFNRVLDLGALLKLAKAIDAGEQAPRESTPARQLSQLLEPGTSMGGARPKNVVVDNEGLWLTKFPMLTDRWNVSVVEAAMLSLARVCGITVPEHRLVTVGRKSVLLVKRFDRGLQPDGSFRRHRMVSGKTVLRAADGVVERSAWSYLRLSDELQRWVANPDADRRELFRRMAFNALISNLDDHPRNHALIAPGRAWQLSPAYDLTPSPVIARDRRDLALEVGRFGRWASRENLVSDCARFALSAREARAIITQMKKRVAARWEGLVRQHGGTQKDLRAIAPAFEYPGFEFPAVPR